MIKVFKKDTSTTAVNCSSTLDNKVSALIAVLRKQVNIHCNIVSISMPRLTQSYNYGKLPKLIQKS